MQHRSGKNRRNFIRNMLFTLGGTQLGLPVLAKELGNAGGPSFASGDHIPVAPWDTVKQINAGHLNIGYVDEGPSDATVVLLLHGWPYDIHSFSASARLLLNKGYRVIIPYLRGYGSTYFRSNSKQRSGQQSAFAKDAIDLMDVLKIDRAIMAGFDWGARTAAILAALWPERTKGLVSVSGYLIGNQELGMKPLLPENELKWWYQFYFATDRGKAGYKAYTKEFAKLIWQLASPTWNFTNTVFEQTAASFSNRDHVDIVVHNYRWRIGLAKGDPEYDALEKKLAASPAIHVPAITMESDANGAPHPLSTSYANKFLGKYEHRFITGGIGHNLPQEAPEHFTAAVVDVDGFSP